MKSHLNFFKCSIFLAFAIFLIQSCSGSSKDHDSKNTVLPSFFSTISGDSIPELSLNFNLDSLLSLDDDEDEVDATLQLSSKANIQIPLKISIRGVNRKSVCNFPPLRLNFRKNTLKENDWNSYDKYKLVTHCLDSEYESELLVREYLIYKLYEEFSDISYQTQLLKINYINAFDTINRFAFLIEDEQELADRLGMEIFDTQKKALKQLDLNYYKKFVIFQYLIGNTDWNLRGGHNTFIVVNQETGMPIIIPYDFDHAGLVNAAYARPHPSMPIKNVRERYLMYRGKKTDDFTSVITDFKLKREKVFSIINDFSYLSENAKLDLISFLEEFYDLIQKDDWKSLVFSD